ncbi:sensor histidine kinase KdpD [uncultured Olegusella sp.]|uniref:sensor histidine kinase n=1 Tax=uncultured Olegusella sp. TaxID=1979846 RepID=UPI002629F8FD|nr:HAMP domain-containing sensor histidine kinase [uncultured Olegusella sp.]
MKRLARTHMQNGLSVVASCIIGAAVILIVNVLIVAAVTLTFFLTGANDTGPTATEVSQALTKRGSTYTLSANMVRDLRKRNCWALLINKDGQLAWGLDVPDDVPTSYTPADVASFARWYLNDYPVSVWRHGEGLVVVGLPKNSVWKYSFTSSFAVLGGDILLIVALFFADLSVLVVLAWLFARRSWKRRDDARNEWVAAVSHDVRTPLAAVVTDASELLESPHLDNAERVRTKRIVTKSQETAALLADLNTANRLRYSMEPVDTCNVHLAAVARLVVASFLDEKTGDCELELAVAPAAEGVCIRGNEALLKRMLSNLIGNSIRHNPQGCHVTVSLDIRTGLLGLAFGQRCMLSVSDDGHGFGDVLLSTLKKKSSDELPEHGLGLVIVQRIATAHGGRASFANNEGCGCTCTVELPIAVRRT